ncbi:hypothetical protein SBRCBS47491_007836 [Sporothrix bragantina]|uniref:Uncharacterized protein n=1 Tax=Sporothrix bragantina TaxID=671064 RepID=A0ABP0CJC3_9PEZI
MGRCLVTILKTASGTLAEGAVETLAPFVFGAILIVTTATAIVLFGIGHVGVASLTESGVFGLTKDAVDTLLGLPRSHIRLEKRRDWVRWFFGRPRMTTADESQRASTTLASAAAEVAEGLFGQVLIQPDTDGLIPAVGAVDNVDQGEQSDRQSARSGSGIHFLADDFDPADFDPNNIRDTYSEVHEIIVPNEPAFLGREAEDLAPLPPVVPLDVPSVFNQ